MPSPVFRFAPSPNGRLHLGHAYSALLNQHMARAVGGSLLLRMEDTDRSRCRLHFVQGIFEDLGWLGVAWEAPVRIQSEHFADYRANLQKLWDMQAIYPCFCSRKQVADRALSTTDPEGQRHYSGTCRGLRREHAAELIDQGKSHGWRIHMAPWVNSSAAVWGDVIIAKPNVGSCYHIAVVTDDALQGITHVVRGLDIEPATPLHTLLQRLLGFPTPLYTHHRLILNEAGCKLSKSLQSKSLLSLRDSGVTPDAIRRELGFA